MSLTPGMSCVRVRVRVRVRVHVCVCACVCVNRGLTNHCHRFSRHRSCILALYTVTSSQTQPRESLHIIAHVHATKHHANIQTDRAAA